MSVSTGDIVSRVYGNFRGVDFRGEEINLSRSPDSLNVWKDYRYTDSIRTRPGVAHLRHIGIINGISFYKGYMMVHDLRTLYKVSDRDEWVKLSEECSANKSYTFVYNGVWYFLDGVHYWQYDGTTLKDVEGYIPTTSIGRKPNGGGTAHEDVNMLTPYRINTFLTDGESCDFYLDTKDIDTDYFPDITLNGTHYGQDTGKMVVAYNQGKLTFHNAPPAPKTDGQDNLIIKFKKTVPGYRENITNCTQIQVFDNRVFFSGNPDYPNYVWHCSLDNPAYCSDLDYYREGMDSAKIKGMVAGNNALWVFREPSEANTNVFYHTPTIDADYGKIYPSSHSSISLGCTGKAINFNDDIVFFSERGMEGISGDVTTEQVAAHRSSLVDRKLIAEEDYANMILEEWEGYLLVIIGNKIYLADSRAVFTNENHIEYEWFYWELPKMHVRCSRVYNGTLYLGTDVGIYTVSSKTDEGGEYTVLTDTAINTTTIDSTTVDIESYWVTPKDKFKVPHKLKTTNKRGCVAEAEGDIAVYAKTEDTDFELIGAFEGVEDAFVCRIKRKKFKDIQLKFYSNTRFSLETATLECFIGGYIKR